MEDLPSFPTSPFEALGRFEIHEPILSLSDEILGHPVVAALVCEFGLVDPRADLGTSVPVGPRSRRFLVVIIPLWAWSGSSESLGRADPAFFIFLRRIASRVTHDEISRWRGRLRHVAGSDQASPSKAAHSGKP